MFCLRGFLRGDGMVSLAPPTWLWGPPSDVGLGGTGGKSPWDKLMQKKKYKHFFNTHRVTYNILPVNITSMHSRPTGNNPWTLTCCLEPFSWVSVVLVKSQPLVDDGSGQTIGRGNPPTPLPLHHQDYVSNQVLQTLSPREQTRLYRHRKPVLP